MRRQMRQSFGNVVARNAVALKLYAFAGKFCAHRI